MCVCVSVSVIQGTQPDRAVVDSPQQAASERYTIETKELQDGLTRIRAHNAKVYLHMYYFHMCTHVYVHIHIYVCCGS